MDTHMHHRHTAVTTHTRAHTPGMAMATHTDRLWRLRRLRRSRLWLRRLWRLWRLLWAVWLWIPICIIGIQRLLPILGRILPVWLWLPIRIGILWWIRRPIW